MNVRNNAILKFYSHRGEIVRLTIPRGDMTLTEARARTAMEGIVDGGIVVTANGIPVEVRGAELLTTTRSPLVNA